MGVLRELKRSGGYAQPFTEGWNHFHEGEKARCPYPDCGRTWMIVTGSKIVSTRAPREDGDPGVIGRIKCQSSPCGKPFEVGVAEVRPKPEEKPKR